MDAFTSISFLAAFLAGIVALFAPCCITYLLPAYFGNIFRERRRVLMMTFIYSLGIFAVMLPVVLGAKALSMFFFRLHDQTYYLGGGFMIILAFLSLLGIKLPMINLHRKNDQLDVWSTFTLGIFSGITSSCCAPVLIGVIALSSLSPTLLTSLGVGIFYVFGMVAPLYLASLVIDKNNILDRPALRKSLGIIKLFGKKYDILLTNIIAAAVFAVTGMATITLTKLGLLGMNLGNSQTAKTIQQVAWTVTGWSRGVPGINIIFLLIVILLAVKLLSGGKKK